MKEIITLTPRNGLCTKAFPQIDNEIYKKMWWVSDTGFLDSWGTDALTWHKHSKTSHCKHLEPAITWIQTLNSPKSQRLPLAW